MILRRISSRSYTFQPSGTNPPRYNTTPTIRPPGWRNAFMSMMMPAMSAARADQQGGHAPSFHASYHSCQECLALHDDDHVNDGHVDDNELLLQTLCKNGQLDEALNMLSHMVTTPTDNTYLSLLKVCTKNKSLSQAKQVHEHIGRYRSQLTGLLGDYLVVTLAKCGAAEDAHHLSETLPCRTVFSWSAMISAYADCDSGQEALRMHQCMQEEGVEPNNYTFVGLFKACGSISDLEQGKKLHAEACRKGLISDLFIGNTLVSMYSKCGGIVEAEDVFCALSQRDVVSWNVMLSAYVEQGQAEKALHLYTQMQEEGIYPDQLTLVIVLHACATLTEKEEAPATMKQSIKAMSLEIGQALHADARKKKGYTSDILVGNTLVSMYGKCGTILQSENMFAALPKRDVVSWNAMLSAYVEQGQAEKPLQMYKKMQEEGAIPDQLTLVFALQACGILAEKEEALLGEGRSTKEISLELGQALHADACRKGFVSDVVIGNALVTMYGKCGTIVEIEDLFSVLSHRDIVSWNAMLSAYVEQGWGEKALRLYRQMQKQRVTLDDLTLICTLQACGETGSLELCKQLHFDIVSAGYDLMPSAAATLIHSYGSSASVVDAKAIFNELREPDIVTWNACLAGHAGEGDCAACLYMFEEVKLVGLKPAAVSFTLVLSACCHSGLVFKGLEHFDSMSRDYGVNPNLKHYGIMIDLLGRAGDFNRLEKMLSRMPMQADLTIWLSLLGACRRHANVKLAKQVFTHAVNLHPKHATAYVLMSNIYNDAGLQECAAEVEKSRQIQGAWKKSGQSWIEHGQEVDSFIVGDEKHPQGIFLYHMLNQ